MVLVNNFVMSVKMCQPKYVFETGNSPTSSGSNPRVLSVKLSSWNVSILSKAFSKRVVIPDCSSRAELAKTRATSRADDAFIDLTANSILGVIKLFTVAQMAFYILPSTVSTTLLTSLANLSMRLFYSLNI